MPKPAGRPAHGGAPPRTPKAPVEPATAEATSAPAADLAAVRAEAERLGSEAADLKEKWLRARADYDNLQKRTVRDAALERDRQKARILESFIPLLELVHAGARQAEAHPGPLSEGVVLTAREFDRFMEREGLVRLEAVGEKADPSRHEIIAEEAVTGVAPGHVSRVVAPGYVLGDKVLRFAKVCVAPRA